MKKDAFILYISFMNINRHKNLFGKWNLFIFKNEIFSSCLTVVKSLPNDNWQSGKLCAKFTIKNFVSVHLRYLVNKELHKSHRHRVKHCLNLLNIIHVKF